MKELKRYWGDSWKALFFGGWKFIMFILIRALVGTGLFISGQTGGGLFGGRTDIIVPS
jgi:hypothetical protein